MGNDNGEESGEEKQLEIEQLKQRLKQKQELAELEKALLTAEKDVLDAKKELSLSKFGLANLQNSGISPPTGEVTIGDNGTNNFARLLPYAVMQQCAKEIADRIKGELKGKKVLIVDNLNMAQGEIPLLLVQSLFDTYEAEISKQLAQIDSLVPDPGKMKAIVEPATISAAVLAFSAAPKLLGAFADVLSYFKVNYDITSIDVEIDHVTFGAALASKLSEVDIRFMNLHLKLDKEGSLIKRFVELLKQGNKLESRKERLLREIESFADDQKKKDANHILRDVEVLTKQFDGLVTLLLTKTEESEPPLLIQATLREYIKGAGFSHLLYLNVEASGSDLMTMKKVWSIDGDLIVQGGMAVTYILTDPEGKIVSSDTIAIASEYHRIIGSNDRANRVDLHLTTEFSETVEPEAPPTTFRQRAGAKLAGK